MTQIQAIVFDLGKVLVDFDYRLAAQAISRRCLLSPPELAKAILRTELLIKYELGAISSQEFYEAVCAVSGFNGSIEEFASLFGDIFTEIGPMVEIHAELRGKGFRTFIFSNTNEFAVRHIRSRFPFFANFDGYIYSFEQRAMKPDHRLYEVVERTTGNSGDELVYIDDRPENIAAGAERGWQVILQEDPAKTRAALTRLGLFNQC